MIAKNRDTTINLDNLKYNLSFSKNLEYSESGTAFGNNRNTNEAIGEYLRCLVLSAIKLSFSTSFNFLTFVSDVETQNDFFSQYYISKI